jgi:hypothetical protein
MYTKPDQNPFLLNLKTNEFVVQIDQGEFIAVSANSWVEPNSGNTVMEATARVVNSDGSIYTDANNETIQTHYNFSCDMDGINLIGGMVEFQRKMLLTVLGEDANWPNVPHQDVLAHASIRTNLAAADHAGPVSDILSIL